MGYSALSGIRFEQPIFADKPRLTQVVADNQSISLASSPATATAVRPVDAACDGAAVVVTGGFRRPFERRPSDQRSPGKWSQRPGLPDIAALLALRGVDGLALEWSLASWTPTPTGLTAAIDLPEALPEGSAAPLLDAAVHAAALADVTDSRLYVPASIEQVWLTDDVTGPCGSVTLNRTAHDGDGITVDLTVAARGGVPWVSMRSLRYRALDFGLDFGGAQPAGSDSPVESHSDARKFVHTIDWQPRTDLDDAKVHPVTGRVTGAGPVAVIGDDGAPLRLRLEEAGYAPDAVSDARYVLYVADSHPASTHRDRRRLRRPDLRGGHRSGADSGGAGCG